MLASFANEPYRDRICVALDCPAEEALDIAGSLEGCAKWMKVGMTLYYSQGPSIVARIKELGFKVFLDLKLHDIPHQVRGAAASATRTGADMLTVHALGGSDMMKAAVDGAREAAESLDGEPPALLGITVLTSMGQEQLASTGITRPVAEQVGSLARLALDSGLSGVVASPQEAQSLRSLLGEEALVVTPGVRPAGSDVGDQTRIATPAQAFANGASHLVIGRPITQQADCRAAFEAIAAELETM